MNSCETLPEKVGYEIWCRTCDQEIDIAHAWTIIIFEPDQTEHARHFYCSKKCIPGEDYE